MLQQVADSLQRGALSLAASPAAESAPTATGGEIWTWNGSMTDWAGAHHLVTIVDVVKRFTMIAGQDAAVLAFALVAMVMAAWFSFRGIMLMYSACTWRTCYRRAGAAEAAPVQVTVPHIPSIPHWHATPGELRRRAETELYSRFDCISELDSVAFPKWQAKATARGVNHQAAVAMEQRVMLLLRKCEATANEMQDAYWATMFRRCISNVEAHVVAAASCKDIYEVATMQF